MYIYLPTYLLTGLPDFLKSWRQTLAKSSPKSADFHSQSSLQWFKISPKLAIKAPNSGQIPILGHQRLPKVAKLAPCRPVWQPCKWLRTKFKMVKFASCISHLIDIINHLLFVDVKCWTVYQRSASRSCFVIQLDRWSETSAPHVISPGK